MGLGNRKRGKRETKHVFQLYISCASEGSCNTPKKQMFTDFYGFVAINCGGSVTAAVLWRVEFQQIHHKNNRLSVKRHEERVGFGLRFFGSHIWRL